MRGIVKSLFLVRGGVFNDVRDIKEYVIRRGAGKSSKLMELNDAGDR